MPPQAKPYMYRHPFGRKGECVMVLISALITVTVLVSTVAYYRASEKEMS